VAILGARYDSVFVQSWSIVSLTIIGLNDVHYRAGIIEKIRPLLVSNSIVVRRKAENAIAVLEGKQPLPKGWYKKREVHVSQQFNLYTNYTLVR